MRILYLTNESYLTGPIIESQVVNLLERLAAAQDIEAITLVTFDRVERPEHRAHGSPALRHRMQPDCGHRRNMLWAARYAFRERRHYDILHVRSYPAMLAALPARLLFGKRLVFDPRGLFADELSYVERRPLATALFRQLERVFCRLSHITVAVSEPFRRYLLDRYRLADEAVVTIPTFSSAYAAGTLDPAAFDLRASLGWEANRVFVYSGSMEIWQRLDDVVRFFRLAAERVPNARFLFLSKQRSEFEAFLKGQLPAGSWAVRSMSSKELSRALTQCDYGVLFRDDHIVNRVAAPIKVKDYLVAGLPTILTDHVGDSSEFVARHSCGVVLEGLDIPAMSAGLDAALAAEPWDRDRIAATAAREFDIARAAEKYHALYQSLSPLFATTTQPRPVP